MAKTSTKKTAAPKTAAKGQSKARAASVKPAPRKVAPAKQSKMAHAISLLTSTKTGLTRYDVQERTKMSRLLSSWDIQRIADDIGAKPDWSLGATEEGGQLFRLVLPKKAAKAG